MVDQCRTLSMSCGSTCTIKIGVRLRFGCFVCEMIGWILAVRAIGFTITPRRNLHFIRKVIKAFLRLYMRGIPAELTIVGGVYPHCQMTVTFGHVNWPIVITYWYTYFLPVACLRPRRRKQGPCGRRTLIIYRGKPEKENRTPLSVLTVRS
jgi:hypothetical protein